MQQQLTTAVSRHTQNLGPQDSTHAGAQSARQDNQLSFS